MQYILIQIATTPTPLRSSSPHFTSYPLKKKHHLWVKEKVKKVGDSSWQVRELIVLGEMFLLRNSVQSGSPFCSAKAD